MLDSVLYQIATIINTIGGYPVLDMVFNTIVIDPPWKYNNNGIRFASDYPRMPLQDIMNIPVGRYASSNALLYIWVPISIYIFAISCLESWGFEVKMHMSWLKTRDDGALIRNGCGKYYRNGEEILLVARKIGTTQRTIGEASSTSSVFTAPRVKDEEGNIIHSKKPEASYAIIEDTAPGPFLEIFAREPREGWTTMGNDPECDLVVDFPITHKPAKTVSVSFELPNK